jgi:hypothetical protein
MLDRQWRSTVAFLASAVAIVLLLILDIAPNAPVWQLTDEHPRIEVIARQFDEDVQTLLTAANGGNLAMRIEGIDAENVTQSMEVSQLYYRAVYALYPKRVVVGDGRAIINSAADLHAAADLADNAWLRQQNVQSVMTVHATPGEIRIENRSVPQE